MADGGYFRCLMMVLVMFSNHPIIADIQATSIVVVVVLLLGNNGTNNDTGC